MCHPEFRRMTAEDAEAVELIQASSLPYAAAGWAARDFLKLEAWVAVCAGAIVAFLVSRKVAEDEFELLNMAVAPNERRQGFGKSLLEHVLRLNSGVWYLEVRASNEAAARLYEGIGFHRSGRRREYYQSPPEDAIEMSKIS